MCGIIGTIGPNTDAASLVYDGLYQLQHRGQEQAGIAVSDGKEIRGHTADGYVSGLLKGVDITSFPGMIGIGHVRYSTAGGSRHENAQPILRTSIHGQIAIAHNGNLTNEFELREKLLSQGAIIQSKSDTELILHLVARSKQRDPVEAIVDAIRMIKGAYSLLFLLPHQLIAVRDPYGFRPLVIGRKDEQWFVTSETVALDIELADYIREVKPGEMVIWEQGKQPAVRELFKKTRLYQCAFEHVYFARPDSTVFGDYVNESRFRMGQMLAKECPANADVVVPVPDSGKDAADGFAAESGLQVRRGIIRNHYVGRSFINPTQTGRQKSVRYKLNPVRNILQGQRIVLVDDSIVRGTTSKRIVSMVRRAGAKEVHLRISCPPTIGSCHYGVDTPRSEELIANNKTQEEIREFIGADSLGYLSVDGLKSALHDQNNFCYSCYTGHYPLEDDIFRMKIDRRITPSTS